MLEPSENGLSEKIFHIYEEWGGNQLLTAKTVKIPYLGKIHSSLRQFTGQMALSLIKSGIL